MIQLDTPTLCLNSCDVPGPAYKCSTTIVMPEGTSPTRLLSYILNAHKVFQMYGRGGLANIVINCHGYDGGFGLLIGGQKSPALDLSNISTLSPLSKIQTGPIWLVACQAARDLPGQNFCQQMALVARKMVIAGEDNQRVGIWDGYRYYGGRNNSIDDYEGKVYAFYPTNMSIGNFNPSDAPSVIGR